MVIVSLVFGGIITLSIFIFGLVSIYEKEIRAARLFLLMTLIIGFFYFVFPVFHNYGNILHQIISVAFFILLVLLLLPVDLYKPKGDRIPVGRIDERDTIFSRNDLIPDTSLYNDYYLMRPENKPKDDKFRDKPGLLSPDAVYYHPFVFASASASQETIAKLRKHVTGNKKNDEVKVEPSNLSEYIKKWGIMLGAKDIGICELKDYHWYSFKGRGDEYGDKIVPEHKYGIAFIVEMNKHMVDTAPYASSMMETTRQYLNSGNIAIQVAEFIRELGWDARAHIDGNYRIICPLVARDAGLGEIGRIGLLINPKYGPRVRISIVTTNIPLIPEKKKTDNSVEHFCSICKKCAENCPAQSIPKNNMKKIDGINRWKINSESCFTYWCFIGTDCGRCIRGCPYSHPNNIIHSIVRWGIRNSWLFRYFALRMDNFIYKRKPKIRKMPSWD